MRRAIPAVFALAFLLASPPALAQWKAEGVVFPATPLDDLCYLVPDHQGGAIFVSLPVWYGRRIFAQHLLADGTMDPLDGPAGQEIVLTTYGVGRFAAVSDGDRGVLASLQQCAPPQAHTQCWETSTDRVVSWHSGGPAPGWPDSGIVVGPSWPWPPALTSGGDGGAIVLVGDALVRWAGDATLSWTPDPGYLGVRVSRSARAHRNLVIAPDGAGGAWAAWDEDAALDPSVHELRVNHVTASGQREYDAEGAVLVGEPGLTARMLVSDGAGGVYAAWSVPAPRPGGTSVDSVLVERLAADGSSLWNAQGVPLGPVPWVGLVPGDEDEVFYIGAAPDGRRRVQKLVGGVPAWPAGIAVGDPAVAPFNLNLVPGPAGSVFVAWSDARSGTTVPWATLLDPTGAAAPGWTLQGTALSGGTDDQPLAWVVPGGCPNEMLVSWWRPSSYIMLSDLVVQKVTTQGVLAVPAAAPRLALAPPWPNPTRDGWTVSFALPSGGRAELELFDVAGRRVWRDSRELGEAGASTVRIATQGLAEGVYRLRLRSPSGERTRALVLMR